MSLVSQSSITNTLIANPEVRTRRSSLENTEATLGSLLGALTDTSHNLMDRATTSTYAAQSGSHSPQALTEAQPEENSSAQPAAAPQYTSSPGIKSNTGSPPEYAVYPTSAASNTFPESINRQTHPPSSNSASSGGMPPATSPSLPLQDGRPNHPPQAQMKSDQEVPIDPSIAASSPTYPNHGGQFSPYPPQPDLAQPYNSHPANPLYTQPRPDWAGYAAHPPHTMQGGYVMAGAHSTPASAPAGVRTGQVYSFVPIPGAQQHKRPRRRYEEIERMYKCGWNGCEKAYGTLNHLNAHVTMQSHGSKRTPEEFKEIRKEWKARKKEEVNQRKADEDRNRSVLPNDSQHEGAPPSGYPPNNRSVQLPPIGYQPGAQVSPQYQTAPPSSVQQQIQQEFNQNQQPMSYSGYPASPYGAQNCCAGD